MVSCYISFDRSSRADREYVVLNIGNHNQILDKLPMMGQWPIMGQYVIIRLCGHVIYQMIDLDELIMNM